ncbi:MAG: tRNA ((37)-N6)-threonylcarbamoyltransferase complex ATPase subunit type 1 TsaE [Microbacterium sp.]|nr:tRNA ((37)-N6)-threonylcarbamoyltransferase complex ATPase subunit type 1 TsaE [Microbacterium sp.]
MSGIDEYVGEREVTSADEMEAWGREIGSRLRAGDLVVLTGPLGAGKTTLTRGIGAGLGVRGPIQSPTFVIARTPAELSDLDLDLDASVTIVEWGHGMVDGLRESWWEIELERGWSGTGLDNACGTSGPAAAEMADAAPRIVTVTRRP